MSPDAAVVDRLIARASWRARMVTAAESAALGVAVGAWSIAAGFVVALVFGAWRAHASARWRVVRAIERSNPQFRNLLVTSEELSTGAIAASDRVKTRVLADTAHAAGAADIRAAFPVRRLVFLTVLACAAWIAAPMARAWRGVAPGSISQQRSDSAGPAAGEAVLHVTAVVEPPSYTRLAKKESVDPPQIEAVENSQLHLVIRSSSPSVSVETPAGTEKLAGAGQFDFRATLTKDGYVLVAAADGGRRMIPIAVTPDALPAVRVVAPGRDLIYAGGNPRVAFDVRTTDDFGIRSLALRFTRVSGSGEQFAFTEGELPLTVVRNDPRDWSGSAARTIQELGLAEGDMLVYRAVASDARPGGREATSDAFFIEISRVGAAAGDAFTLPEEESRYALSQQMLIIKTERLHQRRPGLTPAQVTEESQGLAVEQRMIRSEFVFMLGGEVEDEELEAEQSTELQEGRLANRGQGDLRAATIAMSQAEKFLTGADTAAALKAERSAVVALQRAFARDRYILRALATRSQLDRTRRLTGQTRQIAGWRRSLTDAPENRRAILLQSLLEGIGEARTSAEPARLAVLASLAVRIDTESPPLRQSAVDLQRLADAWPTLKDDERARALDAVAAVVTAEARRTVADPPLSIGPLDFARGRGSR